MPEAESFTHPDDSAARKRNTEAKNIMKVYADKRQHAKANSINIGDTVIVRQHKQNKLSTPYDPAPLVVKERKGTMITPERKDGSKVTRNVSMFHRIPQPLTQDNDTAQDNSCDDFLPATKDLSQPPGKEEKIKTQLPQFNTSRPKRTIRPPKRLIEEI